MLKTPLCDVLGIDVPIILAPMGSATSAEFAATVSNNGGLGGIDLMRQLMAEAEAALARAPRPGGH
jgi:NAD(P)H-dependent flavin oxidoreductase YrpB (nitropropane dioxygenase family)